MTAAIVWFTVTWAPSIYPFFSVKTGPEGQEIAYASYPNPISNILVPLAPGQCVSVTPVDANDVPQAQTAEWCYSSTWPSAPLNLKVAQW